jgi:sugar phosphate isomerase/epimerase
MIALSTGSLYTYGMARAARMAAEAGFDGLEIMVDDRWDTRDPAYLLQVVRAVGLPIVSLHAPFRPGIPGWDGDELDRVRRTVDLAERVGARVVVVHPPLRYRWVALRYAPFINLSFLLPLPHRSRYAGWLARDLGAACAASGVTIAVENMPRHQLGRRPVNLFAMNHLRDLRHFPAVAFDTTHVGTWDLDVLAAFDILADRVVHVHLSNYNGRQHRLPDEGSLALAPLLAALHRRGFPGVITVELEPASAGAGDDAQVKERLARSLAFCRRHFR